MTKQNNAKGKKKEEEDPEEEEQKPVELRDQKEWKEKNGHPYPHPPFLWESPAKESHRLALAERDAERNEAQALKIAERKVTNPCGVFECYFAVYSRNSLGYRL